jgi:hypothetical protein
MAVVSEYRTLDYRTPRLTIATGPLVLDALRPIPMTRARMKP